MPGDEVFPSETLNLYAMWSGENGGTIGGLDEPDNLLKIVAGVVVVLLIIILVARFVL